jgi:two-component system, cell cycle sensor histidine kinase and response regulator CckA
METAQASNPTFDRGTILVVDDSSVICEVARHVLQPQGYRVLSLRDPFRALEACRQYDGPIDLLVTDLLMPEMDGRDLADSVVQVRPTTRVLFMSGVVPGKDLPPSCAFLAKPYGPLDLLHKVEEALARDAW